MAAKLQEMGVIQGKNKGNGAAARHNAGVTRESVRVGKMNLVDLAGADSPSDP